MIDVTLESASKTKLNRKENNIIGDNTIGMK